MRFKYYALLFTIIVAIFFNGCGGGGSDSNITDNQMDLSTENNLSVTSITTTSTTTVENDSLIEPDLSKVLPTSLSSTLNVGFGGRNAYAFAHESSDEPVWVNSVTLMLNEDLTSNSYFQGIKDFDADKFSTLQKHLVKSKYISYWFTEGWEESWFTISKIQEAMDAGYVPVFIYLYFGDTLHSIPSGDTLDAYYADNARVASFLQELNGTKLLIMEPEYNKNDIIESNETKSQFAAIVSQGIDNIEQNVSDVYFSLCMTDRGRRAVEDVDSSCGYENCALGDKYSWAETDVMYEALKDKLSFISFQQMVSQFSRDPEDPGDWDNPNPMAYAESTIGIHYLDERILNLSEYLHTTHNKPVFLPYMCVPTATWDDRDENGEISLDEIDSDGWRSIPEEVYGGLQARQDALKESGLFGYLPMALFDNPRQDYGGYQYFMNNEYHFGLIQTSAEDEVDKYIYGDLEFKGDVLEKVFGKP